MPGPGGRYHPAQVGEVYKPMFGNDCIPPTGTPCADCGCCKAGIFVGSGADRVAICMACDEGLICAPKQRMLDAATRQPVPLLADVVNNFTERHQPPAAGPAPTSAPAEPAPKEIPMSARLCAGGCGSELPKTNKSGYAWGHKGGCKRLPPPSTSLAKVEPELVVEEPAEPDQEEQIQLTLPASAIDRIWQSLPLAEKALGLETALLAVRE